jgi:hypothetical protein
MFCQQCGGQIPEEAQFCGDCGIALRSPSPPPTQPPPAPKKLSAAATTAVSLCCLFVFTIFALGVYINWPVNGDFSKRAFRHEDATPRTPSASGLSMAAYLQIQKGMTYERVCEIIGSPGEEVSRSDIAGYSTVMYSWKRRGIANMNAMFQDGELITKAQFGLR